MSQSATRAQTLSLKTGAISFLLLVLVFLALNRAAYTGYFSDDEFNSMQWTRWGPTIEYVKGVLTPIYANSYRAVGFYYYHVTEHFFGLDFPKYVAVIQVLHLITVWLLWLLMRRMGSPAPAAAFGCAIFAIHAALFGDYWQPMYVFDLLCGTLSVAAILLWAYGRWILSFFALWLAYKSKELAVMLPFVLIAYEWWFGSRRWLRLAPFVAVSLSFGLQALVHPAPSGDYTFHFTGAALAATLPFYARDIFLIPYLGFLLPLIVLAFGNRRTWFGAAAMLLFFIPLVFLPGRVFSAYCYVPFAGLAILLAGAVEKAKPAVIAALFLLWLPLDVHWLNANRIQTLRQDQDARIWLTTLRGWAESKPAVSAFVYKGLPEGFHDWAPEAGVRYLFHQLETTVPSADSPDGIQALQKGPVALLNWDAGRHRLDIQTVRPLYSQEEFPTVHPVQHQPINQ